ncbi:YopX family protein [Pediococcus pentosaceus]|uniref:YopX family protein n=1 Tax=Pediococcus pentosaceus TaxID=1255 RepID=UPI00232C3FA4|nr:YopX family protein [Pediococcus pentosaceus]MDB1562981.1 YopX family protein [Pediococcus pentosaceus]
MIKFRAWIKTGIETYDYVKPMTIQQMIHSKKSTFSLEQLNDLVDFEQFTGLTDVNGKDIYEGDIIKSNYKYAQPKSSQIIVEDGNSYILGEDLATGNEMLVSDHIGEIEVIGNVHTNSELLEDEQC